MAWPPSSVLLTLLSLSAITSHVAAYFGIDQMPLYSSADKCAQSCAFSAYDSYWVDFACERPNIPACLCDVPSHRSASVNLGLSICAAGTPCLSTDVAAVSAIFSQFCDAQGVGANHVPASVLSAATASPVLASQTGAASTGAGPFTPQSTSTSANDSNSGSSSNGLSHTDQIAIICASIGAAATLLAGFYGQRKWRQHYNQNAAASSPENQHQLQHQNQPFHLQEHGQPQIVHNHSYYNNNNDNYKYSHFGSVELGGNAFVEHGTQGGLRPEVHEMPGNYQYNRRH